MSRWLKITLRIAAIILSLFILLWIGAAYYIHKNNKIVLAKILTQLNTKVNGSINVAHLETTLLKGFPGISVSLKDVSLKDSLWQQHRHELLKAKDIDVTLNSLSLLIGTINIRKVAINNASIYLYTDANGYSNTSLFNRKGEKQNTNEESTTSLQVRLIDLNNVNLIVDNRKRSKLFHFYMEELKGKIKYPFGRWEGNFKLNTQIKSFAFNTNKGSFLKDKWINGRMSAHYDNKGEVIVIDQKPIKIGEDTFSIGANINIAPKHPAFSIAIKADQVLYANLSRLLAPNISFKLLKFNIEKPINVTGSIIDDGSKRSTDPLINVKMTVSNNTVSIPSGKLTDCSFTGFFSNQDTTNKPIGDANSIIRFYELKANCYNAPIKIDTFTITNLQKPIAKGLVTSTFDLQRLNHSFEEGTFKFEKGTADLKLFCKADIDSFLFTKPIIYGKIAVKNADITYLPRNLKLTNSAIDINFDQKDLNITNSRFQLGRSVLSMNCAIENFLNFYYTAPEKIEIKAYLNSPQLYLSELLPLLNARQRKKHAATTSIKKVSEQLNTVLEASQLHIGLKVNRVIYNKFVARNLNANVSMIGNGAYFNKIGVQHAGGYVNFNGKIEQFGSLNKLQLNANIAKVNIKEFFYAFDNFGQQSVTHKNLKGYLSAKVNATGNITNKGQMVPKSTYGKVNFTLDQAALVGFEPLEKVGRFAFKNRNFSNVELEKLNGTLTLRGEKVDISPMKINSTALNFDVKGVYSFNGGTNIALDVPLRDPKKSADILDEEERELARMKGIVLHLKAVDENGELKIKWNKKKDREVN